MARSSVPQNGSKSEIGGDWEEQIYAEGCYWARCEAEARLGELEVRLHGERPLGWEVVGTRERCMVTRFGEVRLRRRLYRDEEGSYRYLLDEHLGLPAQQLATGSVTKALVSLSGDVGFEKTGQHFSSLTAGVLSTATIWRLKERVARLALASEEAEGDAVYKRGSRSNQEGERKVSQLFMEADGVYVRLQGEESKGMELKCGMAYEGWERQGGERENYRLRGRRLYVHGVPTMSFWEGASLAWSHTWDWRAVKQLVLGGDGAKWIAGGGPLFGRYYWQLDGFHLARATRRALGSEAGKLLFQAMRSGDFDSAAVLWHNTPRRNFKSIRPITRWLDNLLADRQGQDWRLQAECTDDTVRGLGSMEGNVAHLIAGRMKGKGRSWSRQGAIHMAKLRQLILNDELEQWCRRQPHRTSCSANRQPYRRRRRDTDSWLHAAVPAFYGPASHRPWIRSLNHKVHHNLPI